MPWMSQRDIEMATNLSLDSVLTDGRDLKQLAMTHMLKQDPAIFDVNESILEDPRSILGFKAANRDLSQTAVKPYIRPPGMPHPGVLSVDPRFDEYRYDYACVLTSNYPRDVDELGFAGPSAVVKDFSALLTATGVKMDQANAPMVDRTKLLEELNYASDFTNPRHKRIGRALHKAMFGRRKIAPFKFAVRSSTTLPSGFAGPGSQVQKQAMCRRNLMQAEDILNWVMDKNMHELFAQAGFYFAAVTGERAQSEGVADILGGDLTPKKRTVSSREFAMSGGREGERTPAGKVSITQGLFGCKYGIGARIRTVYAVCGQISYFMTPFFVGCRANYFDEFGYTWHHTTPEQIFDGIKDFESIIGLDVTLMDQNMPKFFLDYHADWLEDYFDPRFAQLIRWVNGIPYFAPQLKRGGDPFWAGNPMDPDSFHIDVGLSSGRSDNPDLGKWYMTTVYFCLVDDYLRNLLEQGPNDDESIMKVLKGEHPTFGLKDMGDDAILGLKAGNITLADKIRADLVAAGESGKAGLSPYAILDVEKGVAFLGNVILKDEAGKLIRPRPNPVTFVVNRHCPERSINSGYSMYWAHGYLAALEHYSRAGSIIGEIDRIGDELWRKHLPGVPTPGQMATKARDQLPLPNGDIRSEADLEVLLDPAKLYYKFDAGDVSEHIDNLFRATVEAEFIERTIGHLYK